MHLSIYVHHKLPIWNHLPHPLQWHLHYLSSKRLKLNSVLILRIKMWHFFHQWCQHTLVTYCDMIVASWSLFCLFLYKSSDSICWIYCLLIPPWTGYRRADQTRADDFRPQWCRLWREGQTGEQMFNVLQKLSCVVVKNVLRIVK